MSTMRAERITNPTQLDLPPEAVEVLGQLTDYGRERFIAEIVQALLNSSRTGDLRDVQEVVLAWYQTMRAMQSPTYEAGVAWALSGDEGETMTLDEFRDRWAEFRDRWAT